MIITDKSSKKDIIRRILKWIKSTFINLENGY